MQVLSLHPTPVAATVTNPVVIKNLGPQTVYYRSQEAVSSATNDGSLAENASVTVYGETYLVTKEASADITITTTQAAIPGGSVTADVTGLRLVHQASVVIKEATAEGITTAYYGMPGVGSAAPVQAAAGVVKYGETLPPWVLWTPANYAIVGKATSATLIVDMLTGVAPAATIVFGLYKITVLAEVEKQTELTAAVVAGTTATFTTPAGKSGLTASSGAFTPVAATNYLLGFTLSAATAAKSLVVANAKLYVSNA